MSKNVPTVICLTPVKNEAWILERFLKCASLWADHIILADQNSDDGTQEIAQRFPKVHLIHNTSDTYDEYARQKLLIDAARQIPGPRLLIALDADEFLSANYMSSPEWKTLLCAEPGTVIGFPWSNVRSDMQHFWDPMGEWDWGFMDDGTEHTGYAIHSPRVPHPMKAVKIAVRDIHVLHYQYTDWERMESKHRWYQCWERINHPHRRAISIYRQYHHMYFVPHANLQPLPREWLQGYEERGIDMTSVRRLPFYYWDKGVVEWLAQYGTRRFRRESIWDVDWGQKAQNMGLDLSGVDLRDPRSGQDRRVQQWLRYTRSRGNRLPVRLTHMALVLLGY